MVSPRRADDGDRARRVVQKGLGDRAKAHGVDAAADPAAHNQQLRLAGGGQQRIPRRARVCRPRARVIIRKYNRALFSAGQGDRPGRVRAAVRPAPGPARSDEADPARPRRAARHCKSAGPPHSVIEPGWRRARSCLSWTPCGRRTRRSQTGTTQLRTLAAYVEALGGRLKIIADFGDQRLAFTEPGEAA